MSENLIYSNGIDGASGDYLLPPQKLEDIASMARGTKLDDHDHQHDLAFKKDQRDPHYAVVEGIDPTDLSQTGWGIIFAHEDRKHAPAVLEALKPLLELRREQTIGSYNQGGRYREFTGPDAYRPGEAKNEFLARHGVGPGAVDPKKGVPYYLLLVGDPQSIPYEFQYQLDVQYAVGRICFATLEDYAAYAQSVVAAETGKLVRPRRAAFFGVNNPDDLATSLSTEHLVAPLAQWAAEGAWRHERGQQTTRHPEWDVATIQNEAATKARLSQLLGGSAPPTFLFTASHGMGFPNGDPRQMPHQGALLCQDWPGPREWRKAIPHDFYLAGDDIASSTRLAGMMAFFFACYGAGTPHLDDYTRQAYKQEAAPIAPRAFLSSLPQRMLGKGGALAVVGHIERAWGYSFLVESSGQAYQQLQAFESTLSQVFKGHPIGAAFEYFNQRYAEIASDLSERLNKASKGHRSNPVELVSLWTSNHDARNYVIIGDPAVRLPVAPPPPPALEGAAAEIQNTLAATRQELKEARVERNSQERRAIAAEQRASQLERELDETRRRADQLEKELTETRQRATEARRIHRDVSVNIESPKFDLANDNTLTIREIVGKGDTITLPPAMVRAIHSYLKRKLG